MINGREEWGGNKVVLEILFIVSDHLRCGLFFLIPAALRGKKREAHRHSE